jgi:hypothetical protein
MEIQDQELAYYVLLDAKHVLEQLLINVYLAHQQDFQDFIIQIIHVIQHVQMVLSLTL